MQDSLRVLNLFMPTVGSVDDAVAELPGFHNQGYNAVYISPLFQTGGSPYAMRAGILDPRYTANIQLNPEQSRQKVRQLHGTANNYGLEVFYDCVLNHIGADSAIFDSEKRHTLYRDPIFGRLARDADAGLVDPDDIFDPIHKKRTPTSATWHDVRQVNLDTDADIDKAITYFFEPYLQTLREYAIADDDHDSALNLRFDAVSHLMAGDDPSKAWRKIAPVIERITAGKRGKTATHMIESLGDEAAKFKMVIDSFSPVAQSRMHHFSGSMWALTGQNKHPCDALKAMADNNFHDYFQSHHADRTVLGKNQLNMFGNHDLKTDSATGTDFGSMRDRYCLQRSDADRCMRLMVAAHFLSAPGYVVSFGAHEALYYRQPSLWEARPLTDRSEDFSPFMAQLNRVHSALYEQSGASLHEWSEIAYQFSTPDQFLYSRHVGDAYRQNTQLIFVNGNAQPVEEKMSDGRRVVDVITQLYQDKTPHDDRQPASRLALHLLGEFDQGAVDMVSRTYPNLYVNGTVVDAGKAPPISSFIFNYPDDFPAQVPYTLLGSPQIPPSLSV